MLAPCEVVPRPRCTIGLGLGSANVGLAPGKETTASYAAMGGDERTGKVRRDSRPRSEPRDDQGDRWPGQGSKGTKGKGSHHPKGGGGKGQENRGRSRGRSASPKRQGRSPSHSKRQGRSPSYSKGKGKKGKGGKSRKQKRREQRVERYGDGYPLWACRYCPYTDNFDSRSACHHCRREDPDWPTRAAAAEEAAPHNCPGCITCSTGDAGEA